MGSEMCIRDRSQRVTAMASCDPKGSDNIPDVLSSVKYDDVASILRSSDCSKGNKSTPTGALSSNAVKFPNNGKKRLTREGLA